MSGSIRRLLRGQVAADLLDEVGTELADRYDLPAGDVEPLDADNWLSTPCVVDEQLFVKIVTSQNSLVHGLLTRGRNIGVFSSGVEGFFEHFETPLEMAEHELLATRRMRSLGVAAPEPLETFDHQDMGVLVLEYLPEFEPLSAVDPATVRELAPAVFDSLATMHAHDIVHGDLRTENVLVVDGTPYFIDATKVRADALEEASSYDVACALAALEPLIGARDAVGSASHHYTPAELLSAEDFLDFVNIRPDHGFDAGRLKGEIEKRAT